MRPEYNSFVCVSKAQAFRNQMFRPASLFLSKVLPVIRGNECKPHYKRSQTASSYGVLLNMDKRTLSLGRCALSVAGFASTIAIAVYPGLADSQSQMPDASMDTASPIRYVIVIVGENRTFDHVFGVYKLRRANVFQAVWDSTRSCRQMDASIALGHRDKHRSDPLRSLNKMTLAAVANI